MKPGEIPASAEVHFCPSCWGTDVQETSEYEWFMYGDAPSVELVAKVPVLTCQSCTYAWTDYRSESAHEAAVHRYLHYMLATLYKLAARTRVLLTSHICTEHGSGPCSDRQYVEQFLSDADRALEGYTPNREEGK